MVAHVATVAFLGLGARAIEVQAQIASGSPKFLVGGLPDKAVVLPPQAQGSAEVAGRMRRARAVQAARYEGQGGWPAEADGDLFDSVAATDEPGRQLLAQAAEAMRLSAWGYHCVFRIARTVADMAGSEAVGRVHVAEALSYRRQALRN